LWLPLAARQQPLPTPLPSKANGVSIDPDPVPLCLILAAWICYAIVAAISDFAALEPLLLSPSPSQMVLLGRVAVTIAFSSPLADCCFVLVVYCCCLVIFNDLVAIALTLTLELALAVALLLLLLLLLSKTR